MAETKISTPAQELFELPDNGKRYELVGGELREMVPAGARHGRAAMGLGSLLDQHTTAERLGIVLAAETGFRIPETRTPSAPRTSPLFPRSAFLAEALPKGTGISLQTSPSK